MRQVPKEDDKVLVPGTVREVTRDSRGVCWVEVQFPGYSLSFRLTWIRKDTRRKKGKKNEADN